MSKNTFLNLLAAVNARRATEPPSPTAPLILLVGNPNGARVLASLTFFFMPMAAAVLKHWSGPDTLGRICDMLILAIPTRYWADFWSTNSSDLAFASGRSVLLAVVFFALGFARFQRRDL